MCHEGFEATAPQKVTYLGGAGITNMVPLNGLLHPHLVVKDF
jgi:hypothetical protein